MEINSEHVTPLMVDDSHIIPMEVNDVTKVKPKRQSKKSRSTFGEAHIVDEASDISTTMEKLVDSIKHIKDISVDSIKHIKDFPVDQNFKFEKLDLKTNDLINQINEIVKNESAEVDRIHLKDLPKATAAIFDDVLNFVKTLDPHRAAFFAEREELEAHTKDSPVFNAELKAPLVK